MHRRLLPLICVLPFVLLAALAAVAQEFGHNGSYTMEDFDSVEKIDMHAHIHTEESAFVALSARDNFRFVNMAVWSGPAEENLEEHRTMWIQYAQSPDRVAPVCSFPLENWDDADWQDQTIEYLRGQFDKGAVGVKIWKNVGMELRNAAGQLVMVDDPKLDPVIGYIESAGKVLLGHLGEPKNCWLPIDEMTTLNDRSYFKEHPQYHMYQQPSMPSYEHQVAARDRMLSKHPNLSFVGCHLASLEWSTERMSAFLDRFPNAVIGVAARMGQIQFQSNQDVEKVRDFFIKYQDRILYGTDVGVEPGRSVDRHTSVRQRWLRDWQYFNTQETFQVPELADPVRGIALERSVVDKIYCKNAMRVFASSWPGLQRKHELKQFDWLAGNWQSVSGNANGTQIVVDETWMVPRGSVMLGINRTVGQNRKTNFEYMRLVESEGALELLASPGGREPTAFPLVSFDEPNQRAVFENGAHDFPNRIIYDRSGNRLLARIEGSFDGKPASMQWEFRLQTEVGENR